MFKTTQLVILGVVLVALVNVNASGPLTVQYGHKKHPTLDDHCYYDIYDATVKLQESVTPTNIPYKCLKISCGDEFLVTVQGCEPISGPGKEKPYPECCSF